MFPWSIGIDIVVDGVVLDFTVEVVPPLEEQPARTSAETHASAVIEPLR
jgi:hypothetical protein